MGAIPRNAIKGYSYQQSIFILFLALMDTEHKISKITVEATDTKNFDDIYLEGVHEDDSSQKSYRIQVKNYPETTLENITVENNELIIRGSRNAFNSDDNNILVVNSLSILTDDIFMGLACTKKDGIIIIPISPEQVLNILTICSIRMREHLKLFIKQMILRKMLSLKLISMNCQKLFK